jgi:hypothetical protein
MVDSGSMQSGYVDRAGTRLWLVLPSDSLGEAEQRLADRPAIDTLKFNSTGQILSISNLNVI